MSAEREIFDMDVKEFNECLREFHYDKKVQEKFCLYCIGAIKLHIKAQFPNVIRNKSDAEDFAHEIFLRKIFDVHKIFSVRNPNAWLSKIADHFMCDYLKRERKRVHLIDGADLDKYFETHEEPSYEPLLAVEWNDKLWNYLMEKLDPIDRQIIQLHYIYHMLHKDIAKKLGLLDATVRKRASRALKLLEEIVTKEHLDLS